jgi:hypothetical protein
MSPTTRRSRLQMVIIKTSLEAALLQMVVLDISLNLIGDNTYDSDSL